MEKKAGGMKKKKDRTPPPSSTNPPPVTPKNSSGPKSPKVQGPASALRKIRSGPRDRRCWESTGRGRKTRGEVENLGQTKGMTPATQVRGSRNRGMGVILPGDRQGGRWDMSSGLLSRMGGIEGVKANWPKLLRGKRQE